MGERDPLTGVVVANNTGSPLGRSQLKSVCGSRRGSNRDTKSKDETTSKEIGIGLGGGLDNSADHDEDGTCHHAGTTAKVIANGASKERADHVTDGVNHEDTIKGKNICELRPILATSGEVRLLTCR